MSTRIL